MKLSIIMCSLAVLKSLPFSGGDSPEELTGKCPFYDSIFVPLQVVALLKCKGWTFPGEEKKRCFKLFSPHHL